MKKISRNESFVLKCCGLVFLAGLLSTSCSEKQSSDVSSRPANKIVIRGSNTVGEELAPQLIAAYKKDHPSVDFDLETKGTPYGMGALMGGFCDIAGASRLPTKEEQEVAQFRNVELNDHVIGAYAVEVVVNAANPVKNLTHEQVRDIFIGVITNWAQVGGAEAPIHLCLRDPISGTYLGFKELAMENKPYVSEKNLFTNYVGILQAVAKDPDAIGYSGFGLEKIFSVKTVAINGIEPTAENVNANKYPYARSLHLYTLQGKETPATLDFLQFVQSPDGQKILAQVGDVPKP